jgi:pilus assembly protein Flp/PilA
MAIGGLIMWKRLKRLRQDESGQDLIEYALVAALIGLGAVTGMQNVATAVSNGFATIDTQLTNALA